MIIIVIIKVVIITKIVIIKQPTLKANCLKLGMW